MQYVGFMLAILTIVTIVYAARALYLDYLAKKKAGAIAPPKNTEVAPVLPYLSQTSREMPPAQASKGNTFGDFILERFDDSTFRCLDQKNNDYSLGAYPLTGTYPDLLFEYQHPVKSVRFAVKCEWRPTYYDDAIHWAKSRQVDDYYAYQASQQVHVFVAIGIGGSPDLPNELYILPLNKIHRRQLFLTDSFLRPYSKSTQSFFSLDPIAMTLS